jgi:hypothetical protein
MNNLTANSRFELAIGRRTENTKEVGRTDEVDLAEGLKSKKLTVPGDKVVSSSTDCCSKNLVVLRMGGHTGDAYVERLNYRFLL